MDRTLILYGQYTDGLYRQLLKDKLIRFDCDDPKFFKRLQYNKVDSVVLQMMSLYDRVVSFEEQRQVTPEIVKFDTRLAEWHIEPARFMHGISEYSNFPYESYESALRTYSMDLAKKVHLLEDLSPEPNFFHFLSSKSSIFPISSKSYANKLFLTQYVIEHFICDLFKLEWEKKSNDTPNGTQQLYNHFIEDNIRYIPENRREFFQPFHYSGHPLETFEEYIARIKVVVSGFLTLIFASIQSSGHILQNSFQPNSSLSIYDPFDLADRKLKWYRSIKLLLSKYIEYLPQPSNIQEVQDFKKRKKTDIASFNRLIDGIEKELRKGDGHILGKIDKQIPNILQSLNKAEKLARVSRYFSVFSIPLAGFEVVQGIPPIASITSAIIGVVTDFGTSLKKRSACWLNVFR